MGDSKYISSHCLNSQIFTLRLCGLWFEEKASKGMKAYVVGVLVILVTFDILNAVQAAVFDSAKLELLISDGVLCFAGISIAGKSCAFFYYQAEINELINEFEMLSNTKTELDKNQLKKENELVKTVFIFYSTASYLSGFVAIIAPLIKYIIFHEELTLPFFSYEFLLNNSQWLFGFFYCLQSLGITIYLLIDVGTDGFLWVCLSMTNFELKMLKKRLLETSEILAGSSALENDNQYKHLVQCFQHYRQIERIVELINRIFDVTVLIQFGMLTLTICFTLLAYIMPEMSNYTALSLLPYFGVTASQILLPCWLGSNLDYESTTLTDTIYSSNWVGQNRKYRKSILLFMERTQLPLLITICKLFHLTLDNFVKIMKFSYSFHALLRYTADKKASDVDMNK